jgi:hypothetical protein
LGVKEKMQTNEKKSPRVFESTDLMALVGIHPTYLNKFIERGQYGIESSVRTGRGRGKRRLFDSEDVFGVALVWWLFESGLRSGAIQYALNQICGGHLGSKANDAAIILLEKDTKMLAIKREARSAKELAAEYPAQKVYFVDDERAAQLAAGTTTASVLLIPVGNLFANLKDKMEAL